MQHNLLTSDLTSGQVTVVFQGGIQPDLLGSGREDGNDFLYNVARTRAALPNATIVLSTWDSRLPERYASADILGIDQLVLNPDPGGLPNIKFGYDAPNNVNRQIVSTQAGLAQVTTPYALKLRSDSYLINDNLLPFYQYYTEQIHTNTSQAASGYSPIVVPNFFTIDPTMYEHMAFHVSDWAQFGRQETLSEYWSVPLMMTDNATYFERHSHDPDGRFADNAFRTRLAVEQHLATHWAQKLGFVIPKHYNNITAQILDAHNRFLASQIIVLDMADFGLSLPKYAWTLTDEFMAINCLSHDDWYQLFYDHWYPNQVDTMRLAHAEARLKIKSAASRAFTQTSNPAQVLARLYP